MIDKVKDLFKGHPELILGFNTFLPKVPAAAAALPRRRRHAPHAARPAAAIGRRLTPGTRCLQGYEIRLDDVPPNVQSWQPPVRGRWRLPASQRRRRRLGRPRHRMHGGPRPRACMLTGVPCALDAAQSTKQPPPAAAQPSKPPVEFDQAISYVNKIKVRSWAFPG